MKIAIFCQPRGPVPGYRNGHFIRGIVSELVQRGHYINVYEIATATTNSLKRESPHPPPTKVYDEIASVATWSIDPGHIDLGYLLDNIDLAIVHEAIPETLARQIGDYRATSGQLRLLFHDTNHRAVTERESITRIELRHYDGVLACGEILRDLYLIKGWTERAWIWHQAADTRLFHPRDDVPYDGDLVWIGNDVDDQRGQELYDLVFLPATELNLKGRAYGTGYSANALHQLGETGIEYHGWRTNDHVPEILVRHRMTVYVPRRPFVAALPGVPGITLFEAMACGVPLVSAPWEDTEGLFTPHRDYLVANNATEMKWHLQGLLYDQDMATEVALQGHQSILAKHTCAHRVDELLAICLEMGMPVVKGEPREGNVDAMENSLTGERGL